jgi:hypothetical protein
MDEASTAGRPPDPYEGRRQADQLTAEEITAIAAWWFPPPDGHLTGPDACTVLPITEVDAGADGIVAFPDGRYLLRAEFVLACGERVPGHVTYVAGETPTFGSQEPTLCLPQGQVPLWHGILVPDRDRLAGIGRMLGRPSGEVFPLRWRTALRPPEGEIAGTAEGLAIWRDGRIEWIVP